MSASRRKRPNCCVAVRRRYVPILLQKSLMPSANSDSVALMRFAAEAGDDGAAQSRHRAAVYSFSIEEVVPEDHLVRKLAAVLDLSWVHAELALLYNKIVMPSLITEM